MLQQILAIFVVVTAVLYLVLRFRRAMKSPRGFGCSGCRQCPPLVIEELVVFEPHFPPHVRPSDAQAPRKSSSET